MENKRLKILIACDSSRTLLGFRGKLIEALVKNNDVAVFTPKIDFETISQQLTTLGVKIYENSLDGSNVSVLSDIRYIQRIYHLIRTEKPDVFFPYTFKPVIYGSIIANLCGVHRIVPMLTGLGYNFSNEEGKKNIISQITRLLLKLSLRSNSRIRLILQNKDDYYTLLYSGIITENQKTFIVNGSGVDLSYYEYSHPESKSQSFLMIARLINAKGVREYYEAAKLIKQYYPEVSFKLIGPRDSNIDSIDQKLYNNIMCGEVVDYLGEVRDVRPYIRTSSVVVLPSYYGEGVPRCLLEALAMGRAIITCNSVGCKETIDLSPGRQTGFLIPVRNSAALAEKMRYFLNNPADTIAFGRNARSFACEKFDVQKVNCQMLKILESSVVAVN